ncbi:phosphatase family protein [Theileria parva strain Muguga]|uniref:phosphatase family protein n=1 Tax=Theileria parva strain Muguga TaxID=333668 RepID=UPI001C61F4C7|nr:phosphatase family protein [Theileria parva strain Muguga]EAN33574.2 phosphatase family protein [Theileria parva strain Muguga]
MEILLKIFKILYFSIFFSTLSPLVKYGISKHTNTVMLELGSLPDMDQMLPNEESPSLSDYSEPLVAKKTTLENFPNPFMNPIECNRVNVQESYVCDPDKVLNNSEADRLDELLSLERLNSIHHCEGFGDVPYKIGVALINRIPREDLSTLADELLDRWKLSHQKCEDGIIIVYTKQDPDVVIKWNKGVEPYLSTKVVSSIYPMCQNLLQNEKLAIAVEKCTSFVTKRVTGEILPPKETPQM